MAKLAGVDVPALIGREVGRVLTGDEYDFVLRHATTGARGADLTAGNNPTYTDHACRGVVSSYSAALIDGTSIKRGDRQVMILARTITPPVIPAQHDRIIVEGAEWYVVEVPDRDPVSATYTLQVRGA